MSSQSKTYQANGVASANGEHPCSAHVNSDKSGADNPNKSITTQACAPCCSHTQYSHVKDKKQRSPLSKIADKISDLSHHNDNQSKYDKIMKEDSLPHGPADNMDGTATSKQGNLSNASLLQNKHVYLLLRNTLSEHVVNKSERVIHYLKDLSEAKDKVYAKFLKYHSSDDLVPVSSKVLIFDSELSVKKAFYALVYNNCRAALVWDTEKQLYDGMITVSDFIYILVKHYKSPLVKMEEIENHTIKTWKDDIGQNGKDRKPLAYVTEEMNIVDALKSLNEHKIHRLPVFDRGTRDPMHILSHKRIMRFLYMHMNNIPIPDFMHKTLEELAIGTYTNVATVSEDTSVYEALSLLMSRRISAVPVLDKHGRCINLYAKFDAMNLAAHKCYDNLDIPVKKALEMRNQFVGGKGVKHPEVYSCCKEDTLMDVLHKFMTTEVHRLTVHNRKGGALIGIVSLSDILSYIILKQE